MKVSKSLKLSVLGICCSLGLSGFAYSQSAFEGSPLAQVSSGEFAPTISMDDDNNVSIVASNDNRMNLTIFPESSGRLLYRIQVFAATNVTLVDATGSFFDGSTGQQINNLTITTGRGNDRVQFTSPLSDINIPITGDLRIDTRNGDDAAFVANVDVGGRISIRGRAGNDAVIVGNISADSLYIGGGPGDRDFVEISDSVITNRVSFSGGRGNDDLLFIRSNDFRQEPRVVNFEN